MTIHGPAPTAGPSQGGSLVSALASAFGSGSGAPSTPSTPISSLAALRQAVSGIVDYNGLYANIAGFGKRRVYRSPSLLVTGRTTLAFLVSR